MGPVAEQLVIFVLNKLLTAEVIKGAEQDFVNFVAKLAEKSPTKIDDELVKILAFALNVDAP